MEGVRVANDGTIYTCNLSGAPGSRFLIFKWTSEATGVAPTVVYDSGAGTSFQWRIGDYIDLRAEIDVIAAFSNCPQIHNACNGFHLTPLQAIVYEYSPC